MPTLNKTILSFDFGDTRIGVAMGNTLIKIPHPLATLTGKNKYDKLEHISLLIDQWKPQLLLVGIPTADDQDEQKINLIYAIKKFANRMHYKFKLPVEFIEEDYSSFNASLQLKDQGIYGINQKGKLDQLAACCILQTFFDKVT
jgi:putative Holliday junction resolvase